SHQRASRPARYQPTRKKRNEGQHPQLSFSFGHSDPWRDGTIAFVLPCAVSRLPASGTSTAVVRRSSPNRRTATDWICAGVTSRRRCIRRSDVSTPVPLTHWLPSSRAWLNRESSL